MIDCHIADGWPCSRVRRLDWSSSSELCDACHLQAARRSRRGGRRRLACFQNNTTTQEWNQSSSSPWMVFGCCGRDGNSFHSSCPLRWSWNMRLHQKEPWSISEPSRLPLSAACGSLVLFLGTGRCCGPGGMLPTMGHLLEQVSPRA